MPDGVCVGGSSPPISHRIFIPIGTDLRLTGKPQEQKCDSHGHVEPAGKLSLLDSFFPFFCGQFTRFYAPTNLILTSEFLPNANGDEREIKPGAESVERDDAMIHDWEVPFGTGTSWGSSGNQQTSPGKIGGEAVYRMAQLPLNFEKILAKSVKPPCLARPTPVD